MTDRKEMIKVLEHCMQDDCNGCPNHFSDGRATCEIYMYGRVASIPKTAIQDTIDMLKDQEPSRPTVHENAYGWKFYYCPRCGRPVIKSTAYGHPRYCVNCGKELIWNG